MTTTPQDDAPVRNQCDGCLRGLPLDDKNQCYHMENGRAVMGCTRYLYAPNPVPAPPGEYAAGDAEALEHLRTLAEWAYRTGYHELGYDPVKYIATRVAALVAERDSGAYGLAQKLRAERAEAALAEARAENDRLRKCVTCGWRSDTHAPDCPQGKDQPTGGDCPRCKGSGEGPIMVREYDPQDDHEELGECHLCKGTGAVLASPDPIAKPVAAQVMKMRCERCGHSATIDVYEARLCFGSDSPSEASSSSSLATSSPQSGSNAAPAVTEARVQRMAEWLRGNDSRRKLWTYLDMETYRELAREALQAALEPC